MGWLFVISFVLVALAVLWRFAALPRHARELGLAALAVALLGYAIQGSPGEPSHPVRSREDPRNLDPRRIASRKAMLGQFGSDAQWLDFGDTLNKMGQSQLAVTAMRSGLKEHPDSVDLWVGLGNALVAHAGGLITPAARLAFQRGAEISPVHPGPPFFYGLALAESGNTEAALQIWQALLARTPPGAPWRADLETRIAELTGAVKP